jgi:hypothetical protein
MRCSTTYGYPVLAIAIPLLDKPTPLGAQYSHYARP